MIFVLFFNLCSFTETDDLSAFVTPKFPIPAGPLSFNKNVVIPSIAPAGDYVLNLTYQDSNKHPLTCMEVDITLV
jgi:hypothetical protein